MNCCKCNCVCLSVISGLVAGIIIGILYTFGFVSPFVASLIGLAIGVIGLFLSPLYALNTSFRGEEHCFCRYRRLILVSALGAIIASVVGLLLSGPAPVFLVAIVLGLVTLFATMLVVALVCLINCMCRSC